MMKMHATTLNGMLRCIALLVTLPSLLAAPIPAKNIDESLRASVVRIEVAAAPPNYLQPWQVGQQEHRRGSGFQIAGRRILTNHHVIEDAVDIRVSRGGEAKRWHARVVTFAPDVDLAVIEIVDAAAFFANGAAPAVLSSSLPALQARVSVLGFPSGGRTICVTEGIVSRVDVKNYRLGFTASLAGGDNLVIQIDAAINGGNSGGPCFGSDGRVVGVAFQGIDAAQNVGYVIPAAVVRTFLLNSGILVDGVDDGVVPHSVTGYAGVQEIPYRWQPLESPALRARLGVPDDASGVAITAVSAISSLSAERRNVSSITAVGDAAGRGADWLQIDDVITAIDGHSLGNDNSVTLRAGEIVRADYLITSKPIGVPTSFDTLRNGISMKLSAVLTPLPPPIPRNHAFDSWPEWLLIGGLVFTRLTAALVDAASANGMPTSVHEIYQLAVSSRNHGFRGEAGTDTVILLDLLAHDVNFGYVHDGWRVLTSLNNQPVRSLEQLYAMWKQRAAAASSSAPSTRKPRVTIGSAAAPDEFLEFRFHDYTRVVMHTQAAVESESILLMRHGIPSAASPGLGLNRTAAAATASVGSDLGATAAPALAAGSKRRRGGTAAEAIEVQGEIVGVAGGNATVSTTAGSTHVRAPTSTRRLVARAWRQGRFHTGEPKAPAEREAGTRR